MESLGEQLKAARIAMSMSLDDISNGTNISKQYLKALEADDYSIFPALIYVKGFLAVYAKYVGLDPEALTDQYNKSTMLNQLSDKETSEKSVQRHKARRTTLRRFIPLFIVLAVIICLAILLWFQRDRFI